MKLKHITRDKFTDDQILEFDNGNELRSYHDRDCCEQVYADFDVLKNYNTLGATADKTIFDVEFSPDLFANIELIDNEGFKLGYKEGCVFIPCHNRQNGYYSGALALIYTRQRKKLQVEERISISRCTKKDFSY